ncbi:MAG TPA: hypothetical protein VFL30_04645 [Rhodanobacteraceae bacterium]|nr:hypothetical protein [Rhodanobacteraceae bacterium]
MRASYAPGGADGGDDERRDPCATLLEQEAKALGVLTKSRANSASRDDGAAL